MGARRELKPTEDGNTCEIEIEYDPLLGAFLCEEPATACWVWKDGDRPLYVCLEHDHNIRLIENGPERKE